MHSNTYIAQINRLRLSPSEALDALRQLHPQTAHDAELIQEAIRHFASRFSLGFARQVSGLPLAA